MNIHFLTILLLFGFVHINDGYKFLVFAATSGKSHMIGKGRIADTLAEGGHNVVSSLDFRNIA